MSRAQDLATSYSMFDHLPDAARDQIGVELAIIGRDILALQQTRVPKDTGALEGGLGVALLLDKLRVRVGLNNLKGGRAKLFYGRIVEYGRSAQTVLVQRRRRVLAAIGGGKTAGVLRTRRGRKRAEDIASTYSLRVKARAARPFVQVGDPDIDAVVLQRLADFWAKVLAKAEAA